MLHVSHIQAGNIKYFIESWMALTSDRWILQCVSGYKIEFDSVPFQKYVPKPHQFSEEEVHLVDDEIRKMLSKGAIEFSNFEEDQFISNIFLVAKKGGKVRPVINLKELNKFVSYYHFKQENLDMVLKSVSELSFFTSVDLCEAYWSVPIHEDDKKYLKFVWKGQLFAFTALPFGLSSAPRVFTKILKPVFSYIRSLGISSFYYIDDSLVQDQSYSHCKENTKVLVEVLESLGFEVNKDKSVMEPAQSVEYLGYIINSVDYKVYLPDEKIEKIRSCSEKVLSSEFVKIRLVARLVGLYSSASCAVLQAPLFYRYLDKDKNEALQVSQGDFDQTMVLSERSRSEIVWWLQNVSAVNGKSINVSSPDLYLRTDASNVGWGAVLDCCDSTQGRWLVEESRLHINVLELRAIKFGLFSLCGTCHSVHICIRSDNVSAVSYINSIGGSVQTLHEEAKEIWLWCIQRQIMLTAVHIAGKANILPDKLSREFSDCSEWKLKAEIFQNLCDKFFYPDIDLFSSRLNKQVDCYVSWFPDPKALTADAFSISWSNFNAPYIFAPFSLLPRILWKVEQEKVRKVLIVFPLWTTQSWYPKLLNLLISVPVQLPMCKDLLMLVHNGKFHPMNKRKLFLVALVISGNICQIEEFQKSLQRSSEIHGGRVPINSMNMHGNLGYCGVVNGRLIPLHQLRFR